ELGVRAVVTGRVVLRGENVSINVELVDTADSHQLWGDRYTQKLSDILSIEDDVARRIATALGAELSGDEARKFARRRTDNPEAYQLYLKGMYHAAKFSREELDIGLGYLRHPAAVATRFTLAYHGLLYYYQLIEDWLMSSEEATAKAMDFARKALEIDDALAPAHADMAVASWFDLNWSAAEHEFRQALMLDPNDV